MMCFEICPRCVHIYKLSANRSKRFPIETIIKPMILSRDNKEMQCRVCNYSFKLINCDIILEIARRQREIRKAKNEETKNNQSLGLSR